MTKLLESDIEQMLIEQLKAKGYNYLYGPDIAPDGETPMRASFDEVVLRDKLEAAVRKLNPSLPYSVQDEAVKTVLRISSPDVLANNEEFHRLLTEGVPVSVHKDGVERGARVWLIDFNDPWNNEFTVVNQFTIIENGHNRRPDVLLFVNGLPLIIFELKNAADENATIQSAFRQIETYKQQIPSLFTYNALVVISDGLEARAGSLSAGFSRFAAWKSDDGENLASHLVGELEVLVNGMVRKDVLLDLVQSFTVFEKQKQEDLKTGLTTIKTVKKIAAYHQYYAVNKAIDSTLRASGLNKGIAESPAKFGFKTVQEQQPGDHRAGVVWHTQGSGKSLTMVFYTGKIVQRLNNPTVVVITDRNDLDDQLFDTFTGAKQLLRQTPVQAENREHLKKLLSVQSGGVIFTTIQKFQPESGNVYDTLTDRSNVIVMADEAHRTQYGFKGRTVDVKNEADEVVGSEIKYGFAKYLRDALPNATYLGFTGTPIEATDKNTPAVFGNYIDVYDIAQAVEDGATVRIYYESRLAKVELSDEGRQLVEELDKELQTEDMNDVQKAKAKWTQLEALIGSPNRLKNIAKDIVTHFEERQKVFEGKAMVVAMSRRIAAELYDEIIKLRPEWHSDDLAKGAIKVVMTSSASDGANISKHHTTKEQRRALAERMKDPDDELKLVIVRDMWLTGFDAPCLHTLYIDKPMQGHNLMQAIARVNRVYKDKPGGLVVDYLGIASDLKKALSFYSDSGGKGDPTQQQEQAVALMQEKLEVVEQMFFGFDYKQYFTADTSSKLSWILKAEDFILGLDDGKKRFVNEVTALGKAFAIAVPNDAAMDVKDEVAFFQAVKARLCKFDQTGSGMSDEEVETTIRQVIDKALISEKVIDLFDAAGIKKPDISILSEEFLMELKGMEHKNIALEVLRKLLEGEIKARSKFNVVEGRTLIEMLDSSITRYHNKVLTAAEVIDELIQLGKTIVAKDKDAEKMGLTTYEYAFYSAVADNESARDLMGKDKLRELAVVLTDTIRKNTTIDWTIKENVRAKMKVAVKRLLRRYGYPPDMQLLATETVLKQAEMMAEEIVNAPK
ncbi:MAG: type I restriction endonuclease subunit R [Paludibacteraceae bacterium]|nr:type I restriction endonuclease subunit R [Bacteroidales bacterium]MBR0499029.1 type I restriction endonuclease subunit R [Paludibacteraceae bacterium]